MPASVPPGAAPALPPPPPEPPFAALCPPDDCLPPPRPPPVEVIGLTGLPKTVSLPLVGVTSEAGEISHQNIHQHLLHLL